MADEELEEGLEEEEEEGGEGKKKGKGKLIIILVVALLVLGGGGFAAYKFLFSSAPEEPAATADAEGGAEGAAKGQEGKAEEEGKQVYPLDPFIVNLADPVGNRYLKVKVALQLDSAMLLTEVEAKIPQIRDGFLILLSSKSHSQISTTEGKLKLRSELLHRVNQVLKKGRVTTLFFTEFVVQ